MNRKLVAVLGALIVVAAVLAVAAVYRGASVEDSIAGKGTTAQPPAAAPAQASNSVPASAQGPVAYLAPCQNPCKTPLFRVVERENGCPPACVTLELVDSANPDDCQPDCFTIVEPDDCAPKCAYRITLTDPALSFDQVDAWLPDNGNCPPTCRYEIERIEP